MGYRGDDASRDWADSRRQRSWRESDRQSADGYDAQQGHDSRHGRGSQEGHDSGYGAQDGYSQRANYDREPGRGYASPDGYGSYTDSASGSGAYRQQGGYSTQDGYGAQDGYSQRGDYGQDDGHSGGRPDNDWYGGRGGSGFADTHAVARPANLPVPDYLSGGDRSQNPAGRNIGGQNPDLGGDSPGFPARRQPRAALPAPPALEASPADRLTQTRQQDILADNQYSSYPGYENVEDRQERSGTGGYAVQQGYADDHDDYADYAPDYEVPAPTTANLAYVEPSPTTANPGFAAQDYDAYDHGDGFDAQPGYGDDAYADGAYAAGYGEDEDGAPQQAAGGRSRGKGVKSTAKKRRRTGVMILSGGCVVAVLAAVYFVFIKPGSSSENGANAPIPSNGSSGASTMSCQQQLGTYCHIENRSGDPAPLTIAELFPPIFQNTTDHLSYTRIGTQATTNCSNPVTGTDLTNAVQGGACSQILRASYTQGSGATEIMGTIGVINFSSTTQAHKAGKLIGTNDFLNPLPTSSGVGANLGQSTGVIQSEYKGHYLIVTWAELAEGKSMAGQPSAAQNKQLEQFENDLIDSTVNPDLSQRMITGKPQTNGA